MKKLYIFFIAVLAGLSSCEDYLDRKNLDQFDDANFWTSEGNMRLYAQGAYTRYFYGYGSGFSYGDYFVFGPWADEYSSSASWTENTATSGNGWSFSWVRRANIMIDRVEDMPVSAEAKDHWRGVGRFFRAMEYSRLARSFGDVPWYDKEIFPSDVELNYKPRDPLPFVVTKILEDFEYAAGNVRANDGELQINTDVVLAMMSREMLYFGTFLKYHDIDQALAATVLEKSMSASRMLIDGGKYQVADDYRGLFSSADLGGNNAVIFYRQYADAKATHSLVSYNNGEPQTGTTLKVVETYLATDGLPIKQSPVYNYASDNGLRYYEDQYKNRDPRMAATLVDSIRIDGPHAVPSTTGFLCWKFLPYNADGTSLAYVGSTNVTDAPVLRYGEILLNYAEAAAELGLFDQGDADITINLLRNRDIKVNNQGPVLAKIPPMIVSGTNVIANGVTIDDPERDPTVSPLLWEIRRERAVELVYEGFRRDDLRRWKKFGYLKSKEESGPTNLGKGAYIDLSIFSSGDRDKIEKSNELYFPDPGDTDHAFIYDLYDANMRRDWQPGNPYYERQYLNAIPLDQIKLYRDLGYSLAQNSGWDTE